MNTERRVKQWVYFLGGIAVLILATAAKITMQAPKPAPPTLLLPAVIQISQMNPGSPEPARARSQTWREGIEPAERLNLKTLRERQLEWKHAIQNPHELPSTAPDKTTP